MSPKNISQSVLETIEKKHIQPRPKWEFMLKKYFIWTLTVLTLIIGSLAFAVIIYLTKNSDWDIYNQISNGLLEFIILSLPYFWLIFLALFILLAYYNFKHTKIGYKYSFYLVISATILISILAGILFYNIGLGQAIDNVFDEKIPAYRQLMIPHAKIWHQPDKGFLFGVIKDIHAPDKFKLIDIKNKEWLITQPKEFYSEHPDLKPGSRIKIIGQEINQNSFKAEEIRPFRRQAPQNRAIFQEIFYKKAMRLKELNN